MTECPFHKEHEFRIKALEADVKDNQNILRSFNPKIWVAVIALIGVMFSTVGSVLGVFLVAYIKNKGMM